MTFTEQLWREIEPVYAAILDHAFIRELAGGSLSRERFLFYMQQDALYLQDFSRALGLAAARSPDTPGRNAFLGFASGVAVVEQALHEGYFREFGVSPDVDKAPGCFAYTHFLLSTAALGSYAEAIAALLPCFWIYREVGNEIVRRSRAGIQENPYRRWIETYAGEHFSQSVDRAIALAEDAAAAAGDAEREAMRRAFVRSARLEWLFWDSAYRLEEWRP
jgi:thiaminase/transcriptional activator TenA